MVAVDGEDGGDMGIGDEAGDGDGRGGAECGGGERCGGGDGGVHDEGDGGIVGEGDPAVAGGGGEGGGRAACVPARPALAEGQGRRDRP